MPPPLWVDQLRNPKMNLSGPGYKEPTSRAPTSMRSNSMPLTGKITGRVIEPPQPDDHRGYAQVEESTGNLGPNLVPTIAAARRGQLADVLASTLRPDGSQMGWPRCTSGPAQHSQAPGPTSPSETRAHEYDFGSTSHSGAGRPDRPTPRLALQHPSHTPTRRALSAGAITDRAMESEVHALEEELRALDERRLAIVRRLTRLRQLSEIGADEEY